MAPCVVEGVVKGHRLEWSKVERVVVRPPPCVVWSDSESPLNRGVTRRPKNTERNQGRKTAKGRGAGWG